VQILKVGELFAPGRASYQEASWLDYTETGPMLLMAINRPTPKEIEAVKNGRIELALYEKEPVLWFLYKIRGFGPWSDCPFSIRLYDGKGRSLDWSEEIEEGAGLGLQIILIDAGTGIVKVLRLTGLPTKFSRELRAMILRQLERPFDAESYHREINRVYARLSSDDLAARADIKCRVGR
jgi:hypothetical protein